MTRDQILAYKQAYDAQLQQEYYNNNVAPVLQKNADLDNQIRAMENVSPAFDLNYFTANIHGTGVDPAAPENHPNPVIARFEYLNALYNNNVQTSPGGSTGYYTTPEGLKLNAGGGIIFDHWMDDPTMMPLAENYSGHDVYYGPSVKQGEYTTGAVWTDPVTGKIYKIKEGTHGRAGWDYKVWTDENNNEIFSTRVQTSDAQGNKYKGWEKLSPPGLLQHLGYIDSSNTPNSTSYQAGTLYQAGTNFGPMGMSQEAGHLSAAHKKQREGLLRLKEKPDYNYKPTGTNAQKQQDFAKFLKSVETQYGVPLQDHSVEDILEVARNQKALLLQQSLADKGFSAAESTKVYQDYVNNYDKNKNANVLEATAGTQYAPKAKTKAQLKAESRKQRYAQGMKGIQDATRDMFVQQQAKDFYTAINPASGRSRQEAEGDDQMDFGSVLTMERQFAKGDFGEDFKYDLYNPETGVLQEGFYDVLNPTASGRVDYASNLTGSGYDAIQLGDNNTLNSLYDSPIVQFRRPEDLDRSKPRTLANNKTYIDSRVFAPNVRTTGFFQGAPIDTPTDSGPNYVSGYSSLFDQSGSYPGQNDPALTFTNPDVSDLVNTPFMYVDEYDSDLNPNSPYTPQARKATYGDYRWNIPDDNYLKFEGMTDPYQEKFGDRATQRKFKFTGDTGFGATTGGRSSYSGAPSRLGKYAGQGQTRLTDYSGISSRDALYEDFEDNII